MRLQKPSLAADALSVVLKLLTGELEHTDFPQGGCLLYLCSNKAAFAGKMPLFDMWGLLSEGLEEPHANPIFVALLLTDSVARASSSYQGLLRRPGTDSGPGGRGSLGPGTSCRRADATPSSGGRGP